jgi:hypothetical protein
VDLGHVLRARYAARHRDLRGTPADTADERDLLGYLILELQERELFGDGGMTDVAALVLAALQKRR